MKTNKSRIKNTTGKQQATSSQQLRESQQSIYQQQEQQQQQQQANNNRMDNGGPNFDDLDPILTGGYENVYHQEFNVQLIMPKFPGAVEIFSQVAPLRMKLVQKPLKATKLNPNPGHSHIRLELTTEQDLFFNYTLDCDENYFKKLKRENSLNVHFDQFVTTLIKMFNHCLNEPNSYFATFTVDEPGVGIFKIEQRTEYKTIQIISLLFTQATEEQQKQCIMYRYNCLQGRYINAKMQLTDTFSILNDHNPQLLNYVQKNTSLTRAKNIY